MPYYLISDSTVDFNGYAARELIFEREDKSDRSITYLIDSDGKTYVLFWASSEDGFKDLNYSHLGESILRTFRLN